MLNEKKLKILGYTLVVDGQSKFMDHSKVVANLLEIAMERARLEQLHNTTISMVYEEFREVKPIPIKQESVDFKPNDSQAPVGYYDHFFAKRGLVSRSNIQTEADRQSFDKLHEAIFQRNRLNDISFSALCRELGLNPAKALRYYSCMLKEITIQKRNKNG